MRDPSSLVAFPEYSNSKPDIIARGDVFARQGYRDLRGALGLSGVLLLAALVVARCFEARSTRREPTCSDATTSPFFSAVRFPSANFKFPRKSTVVGPRHPQGRGQLSIVLTHAEGASSYIDASSVVRKPNSREYGADKAKLFKNSNSIRLLRNSNYLWRKTNPALSLIHI